jgi:hypothetical protein
MIKSILMLAHSIKKVKGLCVVATLEVKFKLVADFEAGIKAVSIRCKMKKARNHSRFFFQYNGRF